MIKLDELKLYYGFILLDKNIDKKEIEKFDEIAGKFRFKKEEIENVKSETFEFFKINGYTEQSVTDFLDKFSFNIIFDFLAIIGGGRNKFEILWNLIYIAVADGNLNSLEKYFIDKIAKKMSAKENDIEEMFDIAKILVKLSENKDNIKESNMSDQNKITENRIKSLTNYLNTYFEIIKI